MSWYKNWEVEYHPTKTVFKLPNHKGIPIKYNHQLVVFHRNIKEKDRVKVEMVLDALHRALEELTPKPFLSRLLGGFKNERLQGIATPSEYRKRVEGRDSNTLGKEEDEMGGDIPEAREPDRHQPITIKTDQI